MISFNFKNGKTIGLEPNICFVSIKPRTKRQIHTTESGNSFNIQILFSKSL